MVYVYAAFFGYGAVALPWGAFHLRLPMGPFHFIFGASMLVTGMGGLSLELGM